VDRTDLRDGDLKIRQDLEQEASNSSSALSTSSMSRTVPSFCCERLEKRPGFEKVPGKEDVVVRVEFVDRLGKGVFTVDETVELVPEELCVKKLFAVFPFVKGL